mmetsp:Transcript_15928/g.47503  ORF Transcript_15928/g.47503 Transcript_15928/m.47503 type:complete len:314 (-) Transcript_15928:18-959(-)
MAARFLPRAVLAASPLVSLGLAPARASSAQPPKPLLRVAVVQMLVGADKAQNIERCEGLLARACDGGADVVVLPEVWNSPYAVDEFRKHAEPVVVGGACGPSVELLKGVAKARGVTIVGGSLPELDGGNVYNTAPVIGTDGEVVAKHRKVHLFDIDVPGKIRFFESETLTGGDGPTLAPLPGGGQLGVAVCYDMRFAELAISMRAAGATVIVYPGAFNTVTGPPHYELLARARALDAQAFVVAASPARNPEAAYQAYGYSVVVDPWGAPVAKVDGHHEDVIFADLDLARVDEVRASMRLLDQRKPGAYVQAKE